MTDRSKPKLLIISHSNVASDARVKRQIELFEDDYQVTVCAYGEPFETKAELLLHENRETVWTDRVRAALLHTRQYRLAQKLEANNLEAARLLKGRDFDAVIANDIEPVGLAIDLFGAEKVHADLHEYYPGLNDHSPAWRALRQPYYRWMLRNQAAKAASATTVSRTIADRYRAEFGIEAGVVRNARPYQPVEPTPVHDPIRLVHAGGAAPLRRLETLILAATRTKSNVTLDLYLVGAGTPYYDELVRLAGASGGRVRVRPPVPSDDLVEELRHYDIGLYGLPPTSTNIELALPNKFFDFVQARLGVIVGPNEEVASLVREYGIGEVTAGFEVEDVQRSLGGLTEPKVASWKEAAERAAAELDGSSDIEAWRGAVDVISKTRQGPTQASPDRAVGKPSMIYHVPFCLDAKAPIASSIRPVRMRQAFENAGYEVVEISGTQDRRQRQIREIKRRLRSGWRPRFVYSEAATTPNGLGEPVSVHTSLSRDNRFFKYCHRAGIPVGLFYRDIYWQFPAFRDYAKAPYRRFLVSRYRADLRAYARGVDVLFVPSLKMATYLPEENRKTVRALPSGLDLAPRTDRSEGLRITYVGGLGPQYEMRELLKGVRDARTLGIDVELTLCVRPEEWAGAKGYRELLVPGVRIVHERGEGLARLLSDSTLGALFVAPTEYREFAMPMKVFEYLGHGLPILATTGTLAGSFVEDNGVGWAIRYRAEDLVSLLRKLQSEPGLLRSASERAREFAQRNTWSCRVREVEEALGLQPLADCGESSVSSGLGARGERNDSEDS